MKRICLAGTAIAGLLTIGVATGSAATGTTKTKPTKVSCKSSLVLQVPAGATDVTQGATDGSEFGSTKCGKHFASGVMTMSFTTDSGGNESGSFQQYFNAGSVYGSFTLVPTDSGLQSSFTSSTFAGTVKIKNGTGIYKKISGKGTLACSTTDAVHFSCAETVKAVLPAGA